MAHKPIFPDCRFPDDCQCAPRGYEHEMDSCAVPGVAAATRMLGRPIEGMFGGRTPIDLPTSSARVPVRLIAPLAHPGGGDIPVDTDGIVLAVWPETVDVEFATVPPVTVERVSIDKLAFINQKERARLYLDQLSQLYDRLRPDLLGHDDEEDDQ
jgi:hypothetical protein